MWYSVIREHNVFLNRRLRESLQDYFGARPGVAALGRVFLFAFRRVFQWKYHYIFYISV